MTTPGALLSAMRPSRAVTCAHCGAVFTAKDPRATYCSNRCRQAAKYQRKNSSNPSTEQQNDKKRGH